MARNALSSNRQITGTQIRARFIGLAGDHGNCYNQPEANIEEMKDAIQPDSRSIILVHYGEIGLKGKNQFEFRRQLCWNIQQKLQMAGLGQWPVRNVETAILIPVPEGFEHLADSALEHLREVFGIAWLTRAQRIRHNARPGPDAPAELAKVEHSVLQLARAKYQPNQSFAVRVQRIDKQLPFTSPQLEAQLGQLILAKSPWTQVSLKNPEVTFRVEISRRGSSVFSDRIQGPGGLPVGMGGKVLVLLSGGIDSPVAAYLLARRGCEVDFLHFTATSNQQSDVKENKIWKIAQQLTRYSLRSRLFLAPYQDFDVALLGRSVDSPLILFRRFIARVAEGLAQREGHEALATGDNLSQVASQTLSNLITTSAALHMPILRPVLTFNKDEIVELAQTIGTYPLSILPYKDCCALISGPARTRSDPARLADEEAQAFPHYQTLVRQTLEQTACFKLMFS